MHIGQKKWEIGPKYSKYCISLLIRDELTIKLHGNEENIDIISHNPNGMKLFGVVRVPQTMVIIWKLL